MSLIYCHSPIVKFKLVTLRHFIIFSTYKAVFAIVFFSGANSLEKMVLKLFTTYIVLQYLQNPVLVIKINKQTSILTSKAN